MNCTLLSTAGSHADPESRPVYFRSYREVNAPSPVQVDALRRSLMDLGRIGLERTVFDGCRSPVDLWFGQRIRTMNAGCEWRMHHVHLQPDELTPQPPMSGKQARVLREHHLLYANPVGHPVGDLRPADRSPYVFFASACKPKANGVISPMRLLCGLFAPIHVHARWRIPARLPYHAPSLRLYFQETRMVRITDQCHRHYPGDGWTDIVRTSIRTHSMERSSCGCHIHIHLEIAPQPMVLDPSLFKGENTDPLFGHKGLLHLPVEEVVERHYDQKGGRSRSVLTFEKKKA